MLDSNTKKRIDTLCDILVSKFPIPQDQVDQITIGLIYKFMSDMDSFSVNQGGKRSFFVGDYEKYNWSNLLSNKISGNERMRLYKEATESMYLNINLPQLFRDIFKNCPQPLSESSSLNMFLKEIDGFDYSHSENLGNSYEYLLSKTGAQGKLGQFRTPRHIIDFIVKLVNPQKNNSILDPACGTAGFLISSYKYILETNTKKKLGDNLNSSELIDLGNNINGYDIEPKMVRTSLVNMYLNNFTTPKISEYDCLTSLEKWNDYYDIILANPPFFSPKGGIKPHDTFAVKSKKAEVLFTSYILEHLTPNGKASIIVPEGINFNSQGQYKKLRNDIINTGLIADISLPAGVFKPYASVKTHILIIDKILSKKLKEILFIEITNDGFTQTDTRKPIDGEQLTKSIDIFKRFISDNSQDFKRSSDPISFLVSKKDITINKSINLLGRWYDLPNRNKIPDNINHDKLDKICDIKLGLSPNEATPPGEFSMITPAPKTKTADHFDYDGKAVCIPIVSSSGHGKADIKRLHYFEGKFALANTMCALFSKDQNKLLTKYLYYILLNKKDEILVPLMKGATNVTMDCNLLGSVKIPIPSIERQNEIVNELDPYQKIIDGCKIITENYIPVIKFKKEWHKVKLGEISEIFTGSREKGGSISEGIPSIGGAQITNDGKINTNEMVFTSKDHFNKIKKGKLIKDDVLMVKDGATTGKVGYYNSEFEKASVNEHVYIIRSNGKIKSRFLYYLLKSNEIQKNIKSYIPGQIGGITLEIKNLEIPLPDLSVQNEIENELNKHQKIIDNNYDLIDLYENKIKSNLDEIWK